MREGGGKLKSIPEPYRAIAEPLIHEIGLLADKLLPIVTELGDSLEVECGDCVLEIRKKK